MPYAACVHDFAITDEWVIFPFFPLITDLDVIKDGGAYYQWNPDQETVIALVPRYGDDASGIRWFRGPATSAGHMMNAVREGTKVHLDLCLYEGNCFPFFTTPQGERTPPVPPFLTRITLDLERNDGGFEKTRLLGPSCEMPRTDDRYQGRAYRHGYMIVYRAQDGSSATGAYRSSDRRGRRLHSRARRYRAGMPVRAAHAGQPGGRRLAAGAGGARLAGAQRPRHPGCAEPGRRAGGDDQAAGAGARTFHGAAGAGGDAGGGMIIRCAKANQLCKENRGQKTGCVSGLFAILRLNHVS